MLCRWLILQPEWYIHRGIRNVLNTEAWVHGQLLLCFQTEIRFLIQRWQARFRCQISPDSRQRLIRRSLVDLELRFAVHGHPHFFISHLFSEISHVKVLSLEPQGNLPNYCGQPENLRVWRYFKSQKRPMQMCSRLQGITDAHPRLLYPAKRSKP